MKLQINCTTDEYYKSHGFGALMNKAIAIIAEHYDKYKNYNVAIDCPQIKEMFPHIPRRHKFDYIIKSQRDLIFNTLIDEQTHAPHDFEKLKLQHEAYINVFQIQVNSKNKHKFGIHLRGTDKSTEIAPPKLLTVYHHIDEWLAKDPDNYIFLATDDNRYLVTLMEKYGDKLKCNPDHTRSNDAKPIHFDFENRPKLNWEMFKEVAQLASSTQIGYCYSNMSYLALTVGINNFESIINLQDEIK